MNGFGELVKTLGPTRLAAMGAVAAILVGVFAFIMLRISTPQMTPLYTDLTFEDSSAIVSQLESLAVLHELRNDGSTILVPEEEVFRTRMRLAEQGLPLGGSVGYEIFDKADTLGTTSFVQNINHTRALEGELVRTIRSIGRIKAARVHLVIPERKLFQRDFQPPTASIVLNVRGSLDPGQIRAIQHIVATAVEGLQPNFVSIVDETGRLLASGAGEEGEGFIASSLQERAQSMEARLRSQVEEIVNSVVGVGRSRVRVAMELDHNRITETQETFDPDGQVVRSTQTREENSSTIGRAGAVTAGTQLPETGQQTGEDANRNISNQAEEIVNFEISKSTKTEVVEAGGVRRVSVAVLVDGVYAPDANGDLVYEPRSAEELERIALLVRSAVGFDKGRGDTVEVVNLRFAQAPNSVLAEVEPGLFEFSRADMMRFVELGVLFLIAVLLTLFAVRPLVKRILTAEEAPTPALTGPDGQAVEQALLADGSAAAMGETPAIETDEAGDPRIAWLEEAQAQGAVQVATIAKVGDLIEEYPHEAVSIIRSWMNEAA
ncbi:flagellar basal-body MS-ring/collar protein FliF [Stappia indica]|uniref:flagellar basal-body MS-ring/collar protein FliF n=1 Tax=Stappia indica TaxID=538381 RepID=UPI001CD22706|nr:flagellar basal-body MS-ring/collar protein FliF [Stappia indica]MCA1299331.1 flagellar M-ring protein FliF [Stappia indica]